MKNIKLLGLLFFAFVLYSCKKDEVQAVLSSNPISSTFKLDKTSVVLLKPNASDLIMTSSWNRPEYGFQAALSYKIFIKKQGAHDSTAVSMEYSGNVVEKKFTHEELNSKALAAGLTPETESSVEMYVISYVQQTLLPAKSNVVTLKITPYSTRIDLSTTWGVVGSAAPNSWDGPDVPFYKTNTAGVYKAWVTLNDGEIKFRENNGWTNNFGDDGANGSLEPGGANIAVTKGIYVITFNFTAKTYTLEKLTFGLVGSATPNGWNGPDVAMQYNPYNDTWNAIAKLTAGELKIRKDNDWAVNYGDDGGNGSLEPGGANIVIANAGTYYVQVNLTLKTVSITGAKIFGIVGSATATGWGGPDRKFDYDFVSELWTMYKVPLTMGEAKFRADDDWATNYGSDTAGKLKKDGPNIVVALAGDYNVTLNLKDPNNLEYSLVKR